MLSLYLEFPVMPAPHILSIMLCFPGCAGYLNNCTIRDSSLQTAACTCLHCHRSVLYLLHVLPSKCAVPLTLDGPCALQTGPIHGILSVAINSD